MKFLYFDEWYNTYLQAKKKRSDKVAALPRDARYRTSPPDIKAVSRVWYCMVCSGSFPIFIPPKYFDKKAADKTKIEVKLVL